MEYPSHHPEGLKPDELPRVNIDSMRNGTDRSVDPYREMAALKLTQFMRTIPGGHPLAETRLNDIPSLNRRAVKGIIAIPVRIGRESVEGVQETVHAVQEAAQEVGGRVLLLTDLNYPVKERREKEQAEAMRTEARAMGAGIQAVVASGRDAPLGLVVQHHETHEGATISQTRARQLLAATLLTQNHVNITRNALGAGTSRYNALLALHDMPYMTCDADTLLSRDALVVAFETLQQDKALMVSGNLHYKGPISDTSPEQARYLAPDHRLIYVTEVLRRHMFDHLEPMAFRGYVPESGLAMKLGVLAGLHGYDTRDTDNESYWLQVRATEALKQAYDPDIVLHPASFRGSTLTVPNLAERQFVDFSIAERLKSLVWYDKYLIQASERGIPEMVKRKGRLALAGFDQGDDYHTRMWTNLSPHEPATFNDTEPDDSELHALLNAIYSYQVDSGGQIIAHELFAYNHLLRQLFPRSEALWLPQYVDQADRQATYDKAVRQVPSVQSYGYTSDTIRT